MSRSLSSPGERFGAVPVTFQPGEGSEDVAVPIQPGRGVEGCPGLSPAPERI